MTARSAATFSRALAVIVALRAPAIITVSRRVGFAATPQPVWIVQISNRFHRRSRSSIRLATGSHGALACPPVAGATGSHGSFASYSTGPHRTFNGAAIGFHGTSVHCRPAATCSTRTHRLVTSSAAVAAGRTRSHGPSILSRNASAGITTSIIALVAIVASVSALGVIALRASFIAVYTATIPSFIQCAPPETEVAGLAV
mmetsp:Transcript_30374/g.55784  ORF Transcript_30374/g.55784 Transcript_30374/m.55784 type:complete len:201 (-) Transcript_30374:1061-1663(-)